MCDRSAVLIIFLILKGLILIVTPIVLYFLYKRDNKLFTMVGVLDALFIIIFIILKLVGNPCIKNSTFSYIKNYTGTVVTAHEANDNMYETIHPTSIYDARNGKSAYFYGLNYEPLKKHKILCDKKSYMKNYGDSITAITTLIANYYDIEINETEVISYLEEANLIDCEKGINFENAFIQIASKYYSNPIQIPKYDIDTYLNNGKSVLVETQNIYDETGNFGCERDYIVIYNRDNEGEYNIINPNDRINSYFCPSNTIGYGSIIEGKQNSKTYTLDEIDSKALRYYVVEVK